MTDVGRVRKKVEFKRAPPAWFVLFAWQTNLNTQGLEVVHARDSAGLLFTLVLGFGSACTTLPEYARAGNLNEVRKAIASGANVNLPDANGITPLKHAARHGHIELVRVLLAAGAKPDVRDREGFHALSNAAWQGHTEIARLLIQHGAAVDSANGTNAETPLMTAASYGRTQTLQLLLRSGARVDAQSAAGWTPLKMAARAGHADAVRLLLEVRANPNIADKEGYYALDNAAWQGHTEIVRLLLRAGANVEVRSGKSRWSPLMTASRWGHTEIVRLLLASGADPKATADGGVTAESLASGAKHQAVLLALRSGAPSSARDAIGTDASGFRDTVKLKDGREITGVTTAVTKDSLIITYRSGRTEVIPKTAVSSVTKSQGL